MTEEQEKDPMLEAIVGLAACANVASNPENDPEIRALAEHTAGLIADSLPPEATGT